MARTLKRQKFDRKKSETKASKLSRMKTTKEAITSLRQKLRQRRPEEAENGMKKSRRKRMKIPELKE